MPEYFVIGVQLGIEFARQNFPMLLKCNTALFFELDFWPLPLGDNRLQQPIHIQTEIVKPAQIDVC